MSLLDDPTTTSPAPISTPARALEVLREGNRRFRSGLRSIDSLASAARVRELAEKGQKPFATFVSCSDSRAPAELILDQGLGDLFMIRLAGNVVPTSALASIEYAAISFQTPLIVVMGHTRCGAITAAVDAIQKDDHSDLTESLADLVAQIAPSVHHVTDPGETREEIIEQATVDNIQRSVQAICASDVIGRMIAAGKLAVIGALYDVHTGEVDFDLIGYNSSERVLCGRVD